ncbi:PDDEXK-like family protein [Bradyrhizobium mercantei]|uniref:PDDEXK-like family protein n=1 Tax=Bradyrhizobium mercantei TaxID=1904807 RepID=UPI0013564240|nr:PD-(D/E)XK nuclease family protein [Bradyrhizobium mercantei]
MDEVVSAAVSPAIDEEQRLLALISDLELFAAQSDRSSLNIFELVGLDRQEIKHSRFLKFLLTPAERHGLGDAFLKEFIAKVFERCQSDPPIRPLAFSLASFEDALVQTEWRNIDILIESKSNRFVLAIENKIDAGEGNGQLSKYEKVIDATYPHYRCALAYLTPPDADTPSSSRWSSISYADVLQALTKARQSKVLAPEIQLTINHYVELIRRNIVPDDELIEQCRQIYAKHRQALELIYRYGDVNSFHTAASNFFKEHPEFRWSTLKPSRAAFLPASIYDAAPEMRGMNWFGQARPVLFWFSWEPKKLGLIIEVGPFNHEKYPREPLARKLLQHFGSKVKTISSQYTRVHTQYRALKEEAAGDVEKLQSDMTALYKDAVHHLSDIATILVEYFENKQPA